MKAHQFSITALTVSSINKALSLVANVLLRSIGAEVVTGTSNAVADEPFTVTHKLGAKPVFVASMPYADASVYATEADENTWSASTVTLRSNATTTRIRLLIVRFL